MRSMARWCVAAALAGILGWLGTAALGAEEGRDDLDKATEAKVGARTLADLGEVIRLCDGALKKGLDPDNQRFAKTLLAATLVQRGSLVAKSILGGTGGRQWEDFRKTALADLERAVSLDPDQPEARLRLAQLHLLPRGDRKKAAVALDKAIELSKDEAGLRTQALVLRAGLQQDPKKKVADLDEAVRLSPDDAVILQGRALLHIQQENYKQALADLDALLKLQPEKSIVYDMKSAVLMRMKDFKQALAVTEQWQKLDPSAVPLIQRARVHMAMPDADAALKDLDAAAAVEPKNLEVMLLRAGVYHERKQDPKALEEIDRLLAIRPNLDMAVYYKASILVGMGKASEAASLVETIVQQRPDDVEARLQLALIYEVNAKHRKAIALYDALLAKAPETFSALRGRGDAYLGVGDHAAAIADYEKAYKLRPKDSGLLNNFAWVLCTSPDDKLRNGKRALEMAEEASKLTDYKQGHILSTLAAAHAELGDFDNAKKWSQKAIEAGRDDQKDALRKELESYNARKPIRERKDEDKDSLAPAKSKPDANAKPIANAQPEAPTKPEAPAKPDASKPKPQAKAQPDAKAKAGAEPNSGANANSSDAPRVGSGEAELAPEPPKPEPAGK
jgi:tetratricopeptide (TPR) repeat protein